MSVFSSLLVSLGLILGGVLVLAVVVCMYRMMVNKAIQRALYDWRERLMEAEERIMTEKQSKLERLFQSVWKDVNALGDALYKEPFQMEGPWLPRYGNSCYWPYYVEYTDIIRVLRYLYHIPSARVEAEDLEMCASWIKDVTARFHLFQENNLDTQQTLLDELSAIRELYMEIGSLYCEARFTPAYRHLPGMIHVVEVMLDTNSSVPAQVLWDYVAAIAKQVELLAVCFHRGVLEEERVVWVNQIGKTPHLYALLENVGLDTF